MQSTVKIQYQFRLSEEEYRVLAQLVQDGLAVQDEDDADMDTVVQNFLQYAPEDEGGGSVAGAVEDTEPEHHVLQAAEPPKRPFSFLKKQAG